MRERLNAVPEGDWLCEECQTVAEKQKQGKAEYVTKHDICGKSSVLNCKQNLDSHFLF